MELRFSPLFSGSSGNAIYVGANDTHILVDAGLSGSRITAELKKIGVAPEQLTAIFCTHEHADHCKGIGVLTRKYDLPVYASVGTWEGMSDKIGGVAAKNRLIVSGGTDFYLNDLCVTPFSTPHDANEPLGFCFERRGARFAIATDVGCARVSWTKYIRGADAVLLESNYDPDMLMGGSYPYELKRRIFSNSGHLCNEDSAQLALELAQTGTKHLLLGHLSRENNFPELALKCCEDALLRGGISPNVDVRVDVASRDGVTGIFGISNQMEAF